MATVKYTKEHEWIRLEGEVAVIGISQYAQEQLGDVVYVELPEPGKQVEKDKEAAVVESVKAASEINSPVSGVITDANQALDDAPDTINSDPLGAGWIFKIKPANPSDIDGLMDEAAYKDYIAGLD